MRAIEQTKIATNVELVPGPLERRVPSGGATLSGVSLPENTEVTMQAYDLHRDGNVFIDPLQLKPERWLEETSAMKESFIPFSYGPRNCVGMKSVSPLSS